MAFADGTSNDTSGGFDEGNGFDSEGIDEGLSDEVAGGWETSLGLSEREVGSWEGDNEGYLETAWDAARIGNWDYAFENLGKAIVESVASYLGTELGTSLGTRVGFAIAGLPGAIIGYVAGGIYGKKFGEQIADEIINGEPSQFNEAVVRISEENGLSPDIVLDTIIKKINEEGFDSIVQDVLENYDFKSYGLSRRRSNIIGTGRRGLTIE